MARTGMVFLLLLIILGVWLFTTGRITGMLAAISGKKVLR